MNPRAPAGMSGATPASRALRRSASGCGAGQLARLVLLALAGHAAAGFTATLSDLAPMYSPGAAEGIPPEQLHQLEAANLQLLARVQSLEGKADPGLLADVAVVPNAVDYLLRFPDRVFRRRNGADALRLIQLGSERAAQLEQRLSPWVSARGAVWRAYRSAVDGSLQPYVVWVPKDYDPARPSRLDVILHGRNRPLNQVSFLASAVDGKIVATETGRKTDPDCLKLYVFGRGNTSYRWVGESDVFEALASAVKRYNIDPDRIVLRGFSMGGTGAWHLGLHFPSKWAAVEAGAGYVETRPEVLATIHDAWRPVTLAIHDASNCCINLTNLPFVAYAGSSDVIAGQHEIIRRKLLEEGCDMMKLPRARYLTGEGYGHKFAPGSKAESDAFIDASLPRRRPASFRFVTYTPAYGSFWDLHVDSFENLYQRAEVAGTWESIRTSNVWVLRFDSARTIEIDGQRLTGAEFSRKGGTWRPGSPEGLRKRTGLQGPIDDAFQQPFLCVPPDAGSDAVLQQFCEDFARYFFGSVPVKRASEVTEADLRERNLILFGTPETNPWIRRVLPGLPAQWSTDGISIAGRTFRAKGNTLALIYPNPLNPSRYVVLNSGHTFPGSCVDDMHWTMHPRLGDFAVLDATTREVRCAGYFDRRWKAPAK